MLSLIEAGGLIDQRITARTLGRALRVREYRQLATRGGVAMRSSGSAVPWSGSERQPGLQRGR